MLTYRKNIRHFNQLGAYNCGPVALSCLFDAPLERIEEIVECHKNKGTYTSIVKSAMSKLGIDCNLIPLDADHSNHLWWLEQASYRWPIYLGCHFVWQGKRGRPANFHHAVLLANGMMYDGNNHREEPINSIATKFNKLFLVKDAIIFNYELPNWRKNVELSS